ncbi:MAG: LuxR C-terminal-related transcriptional regulator [Coriobacteriales bacterium]|jgi:DNA-binding CsgD family transcriptional regulator|nr:LuxR C-terminal-related transcriptional regulator [Coriobacteriales bacterium]
MMARSQTPRAEQVGGHDASFVVSTVNAPVIGEDIQPDLDADQPDERLSSFAVTANIGNSFQPAESLALRILMLFLGLTLGLLAVFVLFSKTELSQLSVSFVGSVGIPALALVLAIAAAAFFCLRVFADQLRNNAGMLGIKLTALLAVGGSVWLLATPQWAIGAILIGVGLAALVFIVLPPLCVLGHKAIIAVLSVAFILAAILNAMMDIMPTAAFVGPLVVTVCMVILSAIYIPFRDPLMGYLLTISNACSARRAVNALVGRWSYSCIGMNLGFILGLFLYSGRLGFLSLDVIASSVAIAGILAGLLMLALRSIFVFKAENLLIEYTAFTSVVGLFALLVLDGIWMLAGIVLLLTLLFAHLITIISVFSEVTRFEQLSPFWYFGDFGFICAGSTVGLLVAWGSSLASADANILIGYAIIIGATCFMQVFIAKGFYPQPKFETEAASTAQDTAGAPGTSATNVYDLSTVSLEDRLAMQGESLSGRSFVRWRQRVENLCANYRLSPRQTEVFILLAKGRDATFIANHFSISLTTAKTHIYNIYSKMDIHSQQALLDLVDSQPCKD